MLEPQDATPHCELLEKGQRKTVTYRDGELLFIKVANAYLSK
jgi:hypothetical protein